ncbi:MAG: DUF3107 domain-containing protein [Actinobacteria bacterium]|nr:DUF3107 domain-containing protein [Actinomycetota bacterium]
MRVRIGMSMAPREIDLDVDDAEAVASSIEAALDDGAPLVWVIDAKGVKHGLIVDKIAFVEVEADADPRGVGFSGA